MKNRGFGFVLGEMIYANVKAILLTIVIFVFPWFLNLKQEPDGLVETIFVMSVGSFLGVIVASISSFFIILFFGTPVGTYLYKKNISQKGVWLLIG